MSGNKNSISKIYKDIHQNRLCSIRLEVSSGQMTEEVPTPSKSNQLMNEKPYDGSLGTSRLNHGKLTIDEVIAFVVNAGINVTVDNF